MSDPKDPFGAGGRTVVRLNPGGRRATPPSQGQPPATGAPQAPPPSATPYSAPPPPPPPPAGDGDSWFQKPAQPPAAPDPNAPPGHAVVLKRDVPVAPNENKLLEAAAPLLLLLGRLRTGLMRANVTNLNDQAAAAIEEFDKRLRAEGVPAARVDTAKYALATIADDIVQNLPHEDRRVWTQYSMLSRFFGERVGGVRFFEKLDEAMRDPGGNRDLLELFHAGLALGFQGQYRAGGSGPAQLQTIQRNVYEAIRKARPRTNADLSPHWRGQELPSLAGAFRIPYWAVASVAAALLFGAFITFRLLLSQDAQAMTEQMASLLPQGAIELVRPPPPPDAPPPPPPPKVTTQLERVRGKLQAQIDAKDLTVEQSQTSVTVRIGAFSLFAPGQAVVLDKFKPIAAAIAQALDDEPGDISIVGHTDNTPIATAKFPSNFALSVARAKAVADLIAPKLKAPNRLQTSGKGDTMPIASNASPDGQALNRRVDISIPREDAVAQH